MGRQPRIVGNLRSARYSNLHILIQAMPNTFVSRRLASIRILVGAAFFSTAAIACHSQTYQNPSDQAPIDASQTRARELHRDIFNLVDQISIESPARANQEMEQVIKKYIPEGSDFQQAELLLRQSGFEVSPHPTSHPVTTWPYSDDIVALLKEPLSQGSVSEGKMVIRLTPKNIQAYDVISKVKVDISVSMP